MDSLKRKRCCLQKDKKIKVLHLSYSDLKGGAAISCYRLHQALSKFSKIDSKILVVEKYSKFKNVYSFENYLTLSLNLLLKKIIFRFFKFQKKKAKISQSMNFFSIMNIDSKIKKFDPDIIHLHWINNEMVSIKNIGKLKYKKVWTFTDMWPFCGSEHYPDYIRYKEGYNYKNKPKENYGIDIDRFIWLKKNKYFDNKIRIVCISEWLKNKAKASFLFKKNLFNVIPCTINTKEWLPINKKISQNNLKISSKQKVFLFSCSTGTLDKRKGFDTILKIFNSKKYLKKNYLVIILGNVHKKDLKKIKFKNIIIDKFYMGNSLILRKLYSAADILLMPSTLEAFGQTAIEAGSCNIPTVGFMNTGVQDSITHKKTGYIAKFSDIKDFSKGIEWCLKNISKLRITTRKEIIDKFDYRVIAKQYEKLYIDVFKNEKN